LEFAVGCVFGSFYSVSVAEDMVLHSRFGYGVLVLCLFRLVWGTVGGHWSRFASFVPFVAPNPCLSVIF
jgi:cytochrome b